MKTIKCISILAISLLASIQNYAQQDSIVVPKNNKVTIENKSTKKTVKILNPSDELRYLILLNEDEFKKHKTLKEDYKDCLDIAVIFSSRNKKLEKIMNDYLESKINYDEFKYEVKLWNKKRKRNLRIGAISVGLSISTLTYFAIKNR